MQHFIFWGKLFILSHLRCAHTGCAVTGGWPRSVLGHTSAKDPAPGGLRCLMGVVTAPGLYRGTGSWRKSAVAPELQHQSWARSDRAQDTSLFPLERGDGTRELVGSERFLGGISARCWCPGARVASQPRGHAEQSSTRFPTRAKPSPQQTVGNHFCQVLSPEKWFLLSCGLVVAVQTSALAAGKVKSPTRNPPV